LQDIASPLGDVDQHRRTERITRARSPRYDELVSVAARGVVLLALLGCAGKSQRAEREGKDSSSMAKPPSAEVPSSPPLAGYSYALTGSMRGSVTVDPGGTELNIISASSKNAWDGNYRVQGTLDTGSRPPVLRCQVRADESGSTMEIILGGATPLPAAQVALKDDAGASWGQLSYARDGARVIDRDGKTRVEITRAVAAAPPAGGFALPATGAPLFHVRVVDAGGKPSTASQVLQP